MTVSRPAPCVPLYPPSRRTRDIQQRAKQGISGGTRADKYQHRVKNPASTSAWRLYPRLLPAGATLHRHHRAPQPLWKILLDVFLVLMIYDFFYYLTHRFLFHGQGYFRRVHAVHHQAQEPGQLHRFAPAASLGTLYRHRPVLPWSPRVDTRWCMGHPFHFSTIVITSIIYTQLNQLNHCRIDLDSGALEDASTGLP